jgi:S-adenosylmethionine hydrolase
VPPRPPFLSFLSDYGRADEFVGVCHAVMLDIAPELRIVDVTHEIPAFDVRAGALALVRAVQYLPEGIVLAVVDPGVGTDRRCVAVEVENAMLVGPDNGLLAPAVAMLGGPIRVHEITAPEFRLPAPGPTFAGRDVMAPAAAHLAAGVPIAALGAEVDPVLLTPALVPLPDDRGDGRIAGEVLWVDRYGNCQLNVAPEQLDAAGARDGDAVEITVIDAAGVPAARRARRVRTFADAKPSELVVLVDSYGMCALALDRRSAAAELGVRAGSAVTVAVEGAGPDPSVDAGVPVMFGRGETRR